MSSCSASVAQVAIADLGIGEELVDGAEEGGLERVPAGGVGTLDDALDLVGGDAGVAGQHDVLRPLVLAPGGGWRPAARAARAGAP